MNLPSPTAGEFFSVVICLVALMGAVYAAARMWLTFFPPKKAEDKPVSHGEFDDKRAEFEKRLDDMQEKSDLFRAELKNDMSRMRSDITRIEEATSQHGKNFLAAMESIQRTMTAVDKRLMSIEEHLRSHK